MQVLSLTDGWYLKERDPHLDFADDFAGSAGWLPASIPGTVHQDLLAAGRIPDPFVGLNEEQVQWVGERDWLYRCTFERPERRQPDERVTLCCDGLDTVATVWLNGQEVLRGDNMFVPYRVPVTSVLRPGRNELRLLFQSALRVGQERERQQGRRTVWNGDPSRVYVRKAQYHWGWDWGPCLLTAGPWQPLRLEMGNSRIAEIAAPSQLTADLSRAAMAVSVTLDLAAPPDEQELSLRLADPGGSGQEVVLPVTGATVQHTFIVEQPALWWPRGYGEQPRYTVTATLKDGEEVVDRRQLAVGLRDLRLVQQPLAGAPGTSFMFVCNGVPLFCGGANWIPADSFLNRIPPERYRKLLQLAADANMTMLRVWGGGIYEDDVFYDTCDELGLLVWQDFLFACGMYPADPAFQESVRAEAEAAVRRLRHHPCLALWCGNNEDYQVAESTRVFRPDEPGDPAAFPARTLYEQVLPEVCARLDPDRPYWPGSPYGGSRTVNDPTVGDRHVWDVWHGSMAEYGQYVRFAGRFVSEFGMQGLPDQATIAAFAPPAEQYAQSRTLEFHNKAGGGARRLAVYLTDTVRFPSDFAGYIYATQLVQAEALGTAVRDWRRRWGGPGRELTAGALLWQLEDCWPGVSWSIVDYFDRPKPAWYAIRRALAPLALGLALADGGLAVWGANSTLRPFEGTFELRNWTLDGQVLTTTRRDVTLAPNQSTELEALPAPATAVVCGARLLLGDSVVARAALWPEPFKYLTLPDPGLQIERLSNDHLRLRVQRPAKGVLLAADPDQRWGDNLLDLQPDDDQIVAAPGLGDAITARWLSAAAPVRYALPPAP